ncbi:ATP-binding protein [Nocardioides sp. YIM 152315]|uniref:sensor histidine kinase n=1 Tax=Nocardioides sp. YIM 152315 TaxID=3031760 RepID=UPI0023DA4466|nr:ATP-binding protein [Nocardioides sp. YIM 152315]MDF1603847.1 ATP-binding protein [Nocardioides sp. YIM 152315]
MGNQLAWHDELPDPRVLQSAFAVTLLGIAAVRAVDGGLSDPVSWPVAGILLTVAAAVVLVLRPSLAEVASVRRGAAVLDIAAVGMLAAGPDLGGASPLVVLPALWLGLELGLPGAGLAVVATLASVTVPGLLVHGTGPVTVERLVTLPMIAGIAAAAITFGVRTARSAQARAEAREADLVAAMSVIERNRRSANAIFEAVPIGLALLDAEGEAVLVNQRLAEFSELAYPGGDLSNPWVFDESGTDRLELDDVPTARARRGEDFNDARVWIGEDEAARRAMSVSARRVEDDDGNLMGAAVSYADVTQLMRALQVKEEFVALVSHELRTPLTSIIGYVAVALERDDLDPGLRRHLEVVARNAHRLHGLVRDLLDLAQPTGRAARQAECATDLATIVHECVLAARPHAERAGVDLHVVAPTSLAYSGDPRRLAQVVDHLVSNAIKYTERGGRASVQVEHTECRAVIRVRDTGIGISSDDHGQLFNRFFRTREATLRAIQGVGLGLAIAKTIVESHGGVIEVESEIGRGSEFRVVLPIRAAELVS